MAVAAAQAAVAAAAGGVLPCSTPDQLVAPEKQAVGWSAAAGGEGDKGVFASQTRGNVKLHPSSASNDFTKKLKHIAVRYYYLADEVASRQGPN